MAFTAEIVKIEETTDGLQNIIIWVCFKDHNGDEIVFIRNGQPLMVGGKNCWPLYARFENFAGKADAQILAWVTANVEAQIANNITAVAKKKLNNEIMTMDLSKLIGSTFSKEEITLDLSDNFNSSNLVTINQDGIVS